LVGAALALVASTAVAQAVVTTQASLLDRIQIEDLLVAYYQPFGSGEMNVADFYTADCTFDVNGRVYHGKPGIAQAYKDAAAAAGPGFKGKFHMLMSNPRIIVQGNTAVADVIWTGIASETPKSTPHFVEQGREHDELVKQDGHWLIAKRTLTSDGGLTDFYAQTYQQR
jgi:ketosteroid isomerase-like protein